MKNICIYGKIVVPLHRQFLHTMRRRLFIALFLFNAIFGSAAESTLDSLIYVLDQEIAQADVYTAQKKAFIESLCAMKPMTPDLQLRIAREYQHFQCDSSRAWFLKLQYAEEPIRREAFFGFVKLLASSGYHADAVTMLEDESSPSLRTAEEFKMAWLLYADVADGMLVPAFKEQKQAVADQYYHQMLEAMEREARTSPEYYHWLELYRAQDRGDWETALHHSEQLLSLTSPDEHLYAILTYGHAMLYEAAGDSLMRREWLVRSAITDVRLGITDNGSSWLVAQDCFDDGDLTHAYHFSDYSLTNATFFNAPTRFIQNFTPGHLIASRYEYELRQSSISLAIALLLLGVVLIAMVFIAIYSLHQNRRLHVLNSEMKAMNEKLRTINRELKEADKVKEQYICRYLEVYNDYIRRLTTMARRAGEKDATAFMEREMENFYRSFDDTFLSLYGTFVQDFNALLKPEAQVTPKPGERLTVEMRIFALILLGITSSSKIAELLCYSPNTISNYRVKMKKGAIGDRDTFEQRVQQIGKNITN